VRLEFQDYGRSRSNLRERFGVSMRQVFCILKVLGDVLDGGELHLIETAQNLEVAKARVQVLMEFRPGEYVIYDGATGKTYSRGTLEQPNRPARTGSGKFRLVA